MPTGGNRRISVALLLLPALLVAGRAEALYFTGETLGKEVTAWAVSGFFMTPNPQGYFVNARVFHGLSERLDFEMGAGYSRSTWDIPPDQRFSSPDTQSKESGTLFFLAGRLRILAVGPFRIGVRGGIQLDPDNILHLRSGEWGFLQGTLGVNLSRHLTLYAATDEVQGATAVHLGGLDGGG